MHSDFRWSNRFCLIKRWFKACSFFQTLAFPALFFYPVLKMFFLITSVIFQGKRRVFGMVVIRTEIGIGIQFLLLLVSIMSLEILLGIPCAVIHSLLIYLTNICWASTYVPEIVIGLWNHWWTELKRPWAPWGYSKWANRKCNYVWFCQNYEEMKQVIWERNLVKLRSRVG